MRTRAMASGNESYGISVATGPKASTSWTFVACSGCSQPKRIGAINAPVSALAPSTSTRFGSPKSGCASVISSATLARTSSRCESRSGGNVRTAAVALDRHAEADDDRAEFFSQRVGSGGVPFAWDERTPDCRALLACFGRHLAHDLAHEEIELRRAGLGIRSEDRSVE